LSGIGFTDTLSTSALLNHGSGIVVLAENPYAAMPSLHTADALVIGVALALLVRPLWLRVVWLLWPGWVAFSLVLTGNHYVADIVVATVLVCVAVPVTAALERLRRRSGGVHLAVELVCERTFHKGHGARDPRVFGIGGIASFFQLVRVQIRVGEHKPHDVHLAR
jgi:membrane-associated phospholipid phosphatase